MTETIELASRFNGPPGSGNGGYCCGRFAALLDPDRARVRLMLPPPLGQPLRVERDGHGVTVWHDDRQVAQVWPGEPLDSPPPPPSLPQARLAGARFERFEEHPYPGCFVCGPSRRPGDGLRLFTGPLNSSADPIDRSRVAGVLEFPLDLAQEPSAATELAWAALDCPGAYTFDPGPGQAMLLGELMAEILAPLPASEPLVVQGWHGQHEGRKHRVGTAIHAADGRCLAAARATWIIVPMPDQPA